MVDAPLRRLPAVPQPEGAEAHYLEAADGARLRVVRYPLPAGTPRRGAVLVMPGWSEFSEKYAEVARDLHARGFAVVVCDPRGQGYSQRLDGDDKRGHIRDFRIFVSDLSTCMDYVRRTEEGPYALIAHSMGGLVTLEWLAEGKGNDLAGIALSAPLTNLFPSRIKKRLVRMVTVAGTMAGRGESPLPGLKEQAYSFEGNVLTQDPVRHERFRQLQLAAPEARAGLPKFDWLRAALAGMDRIQAPGALGSVPSEVLLVSASRDETVDATHHPKLASAYPDKIRLVTVEGARHELLMEADRFRDQFWAAFDQYMDERIRPPSAGSSAASSVPRA